MGFVHRSTTGWTPTSKLNFTDGCRVSFPGSSAERWAMYPLSCGRCQGRQGRLRLCWCGSSALDRKSTKVDTGLTVRRGEASKETDRVVVRHLPDSALGRKHRVDRLNVNSRGRWRRLKYTGRKELRQSVKNFIVKRS